MRSCPLTIRPIETEYDGYKFRSRLEARWAVFFNTSGIFYRYEHEGYNVGNTRYLPDFWLPEQSCYIEIKDKPPNAEERRLMKLLVKGTRARGYIIPGEIPYPYPREAWISGYTWTKKGEFKEITLGSWVECPVCLRVDIEEGIDQPPSKCNCVANLSRELWRLSVGKEYDRAELTSTGVNKYAEALDRMINPKVTRNLSKTQKLRDAYFEARRARFEYGDRKFLPLSEIDKLLRTEAEWGRILDDLSDRGSQGEEGAEFAAFIYRQCKPTGFSGNTLRIISEPRDASQEGTPSPPELVEDFAEDPRFAKPLLQSLRKCTRIVASRVFLDRFPQGYPYSERF